MPIPKLDRGEAEKDFMSKCMTDNSMQKDFPNQNQRVAVCMSQLKRKKSEASGLDWEDVAAESFIVY